MIQIIEIRKNDFGNFCESIYNQKKTNKIFGSSFWKIKVNDKIFVARKYPESQKIEEQELIEYVSKREKTSELEHVLPQIQILKTPNFERV